MKKRSLALLTVLIFLLASLISCQSFDSFITDIIFVLEKPDDTNLDLWIGQNVDNYDFSEHTEEYGWFGCRCYYGKNYEPITFEDEYGYTYQERPEHYVIYHVGGYPDTLSPTQHITRIEITDPSVTLWDLTVNSTYDEFTRVMTELGFEVTSDPHSATNFHTATKGKYEIRYSMGREIVLIIEVTNIVGVVY